MHNYNVFNSIQMYQNPNHISEPLLPQHYSAPYVTQSLNRFVYFKQQFVNPVDEEKGRLSSTVHLNPHFNKKVFVNPKFQRNTVLPCVPKIHINPKVQNVNLSEHIRQNTIVNKIHVNPNILKNIPISLDNNQKADIDLQPLEKIINDKRTVYSTRTKLIRASDKIFPEFRKIRRTSIHSKFKIVKSCILNRSHSENKRSKASSQLKYNLTRLKPTNKKLGNKFKLDNRTTKQCTNMIKNRVSSNKCSNSAKISNVHLRQNKTLSLVKIGEMLYRKSPNTLQKTSIIKRSRKSSILKIYDKTISKSKYKLVRKSKNFEAANASSNVQSKRILKISKLMIRTVKGRKNNFSPGKLRKCNIPCPYYRKMGKCKGYENGKCFRKHDPDQIALCTKFLQGACINEKCLLSHNVSPEKMPTCKFYLEGTCSKDKCPYLHVRINPKADICRDFLEGFCRRATECDKRHQFLCPEYEKNGNCLKQRCPYPHGKMVRKYSVFDKYKLAKKCSDNLDNSVTKVNKIENDIPIDKGTESHIKCENTETNLKIRYYAEQKMSEEPLGNKEKSDLFCDQEVTIKSRPKLGRLPSFIAFKEA